MIAMKQILIVEDERIVAEDIKQCVQNLGYTISAVVPTGEEAIESASANHPDLALMDIKLKGEMDGIEAADKIHSQLNIPIVFLTAHADENTLNRAKITEPFGYIVKPFEERDLQISIEMALYKWKMEIKGKKSAKWLFTALRSIYDAVITINKKGIVSFMNSSAESLTGWGMEDAVGEHFDMIFNIHNSETGYQAESPLMSVFYKNAFIRRKKNAPQDMVLFARDETKHLINYSCVPIQDEKGEVAGAALIFREITEPEFDPLVESQTMNHDYLETTMDSIDFSNLEENMNQENQLTANLHGFKTGKDLLLGKKDIRKQRVVEANNLPEVLNDIFKGIPKDLLRDENRIIRIIPKKGFTLVKIKKELSQELSESRVEECMDQLIGMGLLSIKKRGRHTIYMKN